MTDFCSVAVDDVRGGDLAAAHLFSQGHQRIAFLHGSVSLPPAPLANKEFAALPEH